MSVAFHRKKVPDHDFPMFGKDGFRMKLNAENRPDFMAHGHDQIGIAGSFASAGGGYFQFGRQPFPLHN